VRRLAALGIGLLSLTLVPLDAGAADDPGRPDQWALDRIGAVHPGDGRGITVAVVDSGVDLQHADLRDRIVGGIDLVDDDAIAQDGNGHGTHVAGIIAAVSGNGVGIRGVAPGASIMPIRVLDAEGAGTVDDVVAGIRWAVANGADVINLSLSEDAQAVLGPSLSDAVREAWNAGVVPVIAAGNQYVLGSGFADEPALVVAATTRDDGKPSYSSSVGSAQWGIAAPGGEQPMLGESGAILSTYWVEGEADQYAYDCGTSMAAPHVAGAVAVLLSLGLSPQQAVDRLLATARDIGAAGRDSTFGVGLLDLAAATDGIDPANETPAPAAPATTAAPAAPSSSGSAPPTSSAPTATTPGGAPAEAPATTPTGPSTTMSGSPTSSSGDAGAGEASSDEGGDGDDEDDDQSKTLPAIVAALAAAGAGGFAFATRRRLS
jgi:serine protease